MAPSPTPQHSPEPSAPPLLLLAPLRREAAALERSLATSRRLRPPAGLERLVSGRLAGWQVALAVTGDGQARARKGVEAALTVLRPQRLLAFGVAGALSPGLTPGSLVWARRVIGAGGCVLEPRLTAPSGAETAEDSARAGTIFTQDRLVTTPMARAELLSRIGEATTGRPEAAVVDLESSHFAAAAEAAGVPWGVLRAVSDTVDDTLPAYLERCRDTGGSVRSGRVVLHALARPWTFPTLLALGRRVDACSHRLATALESWVEHQGDDLP